MTDRSGLRYRVVLTILDQQEGRAWVDMYDAEALHAGYGPLRAHPHTVHRVQDVDIFLRGAVRLVGADTGEALPWDVLPPEGE